MARKKKKKSYGKKRVSGAGKDFNMELAGLALFVVFGGKLTALIPASISPTIVGAVEAGGGYMLAKKAKNPFLRGAGMGIAVSGVANLAKGFGIAGAPGIGAPGSYPNMSTIGNFEFKRVSGVSEDMNGLSGVGNEMSAISGMMDDDEDINYDDN